MSKVGQGAGVPKGIDGPLRPGGLLVTNIVKACQLKVLVRSFLL